jgi:hypothetical protein
VPFKGAINKEKVVYDNIEVGKWSGKWLVVFLFVLLTVFLILQVYSDFVKETHFDTISVISVVYVGDTGEVSIGGTVLCLMVWLEVLLYFGFMILPLLLHLEVLFLTSYLVLLF